MKSAPCVCNFTHVLAWFNCWHCMVCFHGRYPAQLQAHAGRLCVLELLWHMRLVFTVFACCLVPTLIVTGSSSLKEVHRLRCKCQQVWGTEQPRRIVVDSGTGATAVGLALGAALAGAPWTVHGVMLAGDRKYYETQQRALCAAFCTSFLPGEGCRHGFPPRRTWCTPAHVACCRFALFYIR